LYDYFHLAITSSDFSEHASNDRWCATVGIRGQSVKSVVLNGNLWADLAHYICQYDCK